MLRTLRSGSQGTDVMDLQMLLKKLGYDPGPIDGIFGGLTEQAVMNFQHDQRLSIDGVVGPITYKALQGQIPGGDYEDYYVVKPGDTLYFIARKYQTTFQYLLELNPGIAPNHLQIGQKIRVPHATRLRSVAGWIPYWTQQQSFIDYQKNEDVYDKMSPFWYTFTPNGELVKFPHAEDPDILNYIKTSGEKLIPLISNEFKGELVSAVLNNEEVREAHILQIANQVTALDYNGIEINYENLAREDRDSYSNFIHELAAVLHARGKQLIVTVHAKTNDSGAWSGPAAHDYQALGQAADLVRIMAYEFHWSGGPAGSIAPIEWVNGVTAYALTRIPAHKIVLGLPVYGYDWSEGKGKSLTYQAAMATAEQMGAIILNDPENGPHYHYCVGEIDHEVWFVNALSFSRYLDLVKQYNLYGICIWHLGEEDPKIYDEIRQKLQH